MRIATDELQISAQTEGYLGRWTELGGLPYAFETYALSSTPRSCGAARACISPFMARRRATLPPRRC